MSQIGRVEPAGAEGGLVLRACMRWAGGVGGARGLGGWAAERAPWTGEGAPRREPTSVRGIVGLEYKAEMSVDGVCLIRGRPRCRSAWLE